MRHSAIPWSHDGPVPAPTPLPRLNHAVNPRLGGSDRLTIEKWLDQSAIFFTDLVQHIYWLTNFVWDVQIEGATEAILKARKNEIRTNPPARGSVLLHNEKEQWHAVTPDLRQEDINSASRTLIWWIAGIGCGIPEHWLGWGRETTRATAREMQSPTLHMLEERQAVIRSMLAELCRFQIHQAIIAKALPRDVDQSFELTLPELTPPDTVALAAAQAATSRAFADLIQALSSDAARSYLDDETIRSLCRATALAVDAASAALTLTPPSRGPSTT